MGDLVDEMAILIMSLNDQLAKAEAVIHNQAEEIKRLRERAEYASDWAKFVDTGLD